MDGQPLEGRMRGVAQIQPEGAVSHAGPHVGAAVGAHQHLPVDAALERLHDKPQRLVGLRLVGVDAEPPAHLGEHGGGKVVIIPGQIRQSTAGAGGFFAAADPRRAVGHRPKKLVPFGHPRPEGTVQFDDAPLSRHALKDPRVSGGDGLHLRSSQHSVADVFGRTDGHVHLKHLRGHLQFRPLEPPHVGVETAGGHVDVDPHGRVGVALPQRPPVALDDAVRAPRRVEVVKRDQPRLHVEPGGHLLGGPDENAHRPGVDRRVKCRLLRRGVGVVDVGDLRRQDPARLQLVTEKPVDARRCPGKLRRGFGVGPFVVEVMPLAARPRGVEVAEHQLRALLCRRLLVVVEHPLSTSVDLCPPRQSLRRRGRVPVEHRRLAPVGGHPEHVVHVGLDTPILDRLGALGQRRDVRLEVVVPRDADNLLSPAAQHREGQPEVVETADVPRLREDGDQLREVVVTEALHHAVAVARGCHLDAVVGLGKHRRERIKVLQPQRLQPRTLQEPHHDVEFGEGVGDRGSRREDDPAARTLHQLGLRVGVKGAVGLGRRQPRHLKPRLESKVLIHLRLIDHQAIDPKVLEGHDLGGVPFDVLLFGLDLDLEFPDRLLYPLDRLVILGRLKVVLKPRHLLLKVLDERLRAHRKHRHLRVGDDHDGPAPHGDAAHPRLAVGSEHLRRRRRDTVSPSGVEAHGVPVPLLQEVVRHHDHAPLPRARLEPLDGGGEDLKGLARPSRVNKGRLIHAPGGLKRSGHGGALVTAQLHVGSHAREGEIRPVVLPAPEAPKAVVVQARQPLDPLRVRPHPRRKRLAHLLCLGLRGESGVTVDALLALGSAVDLHRAEVDARLENLRSILGRGPPPGRGGAVDAKVAGVETVSLHQPDAVTTPPEDVLGETLVHVVWHPPRSERHLDVARGDWRRLDVHEGGHVALVTRIGAGGQPREFEPFGHVAAQVLRGGRPLLGGGIAVGKGALLQLGSDGHAIRVQRLGNHAHVDAPGEPEAVVDGVGQCRGRGCLGLQGAAK